MTPSCLGRVLVENCDPDVQTARRASASKLHILVPYFNLKSLKRDFAADRAA
jgi:hypothetical protein